MDAEHVDLVHAPPLRGVDLPRWGVLLVDARVCHQQVDVAHLRDCTLDRPSVGDVHLYPLAADLGRDRLHLLAAARTDDDVPAVTGQRPSDARADAAAAAGDECPHARHYARRRTPAISWSTASRCDGVMVRSLLSMSCLNRRRAFRCVALIREVSTEGADEEQVGQLEPSPGERDKRRKRGERDDQDRDHGEGADQGPWEVPGTTASSPAGRAQYVAVACSSVTSSSSATITRARVDTVANSRSASGGSVKFMRASFSWTTG